MSKNGLTREENRKAWLYAFLIVLGMGAVAALLVWSRSWNMTPVELRETNPLVTEAARGLDEITWTLPLTLWRGPWPWSSA